MDLKEVLRELGLTQGESDVYLALLKLGSVPVSKIKEETRHHRTVIYDFIEKLITKSLVSYVVKGNVRYYEAAAPIKLLDFIKEKEMHLNEILPELTALSEFEKKEVKVEVYQGVAGLKTVLNDVLRTAANMVAFGIDEERFDALMGSFMDQFFLREKEAGFTERLLTYEGAPFIYDTETTTYRFVPKEFFNPTVTDVYANKVAIMIWEPLTVILIECEELAIAYRKQFEMVWAVAKTVNQLKKK